MIRSGEGEGRNGALPSAQYASPVIQRVLQQVSEAYSNPDLSLGGMSRVLGVSKRQLCRKWKEHMQQSFGDYLANLRTEKAAELLRESSYGVKTIAVMVGYRDPNYSIRDFRKRMKRTPGQFRLDTLHSQKRSTSTTACKRRSALASGPIPMATES